MPQSLKLILCTLNAFARNGMEITPTWRMNPTIIEPIKYIFENNPIWKIDFVALLIVKE